MDITDAKVLALGGYALALGAALGVCWGIFSCVRILLTPQQPVSVRGRALRDLITFFTDITFAVFASVCTVFLFFGANSGRIRLLGLAGCAVGFAVYHYTIGKRLIVCFSRFVDVVRHAIRFVYRHTFGALFSLAARLMNRPIRALRRSGKARAEKRKKRKREKRKREFTM